MSSVAAAGMHATARGDRREKRKKNVDRRFRLIARELTEEAIRRR
jgi:hypothetical protein